MYCIIGSKCDSLTICLHFSLQNLRYLVHYREGLETIVLQWQHLNGCHFVPYLMHISDTKFEHHYSNILGDILNFVIYYKTLMP